MFLLLIEGFYRFSLAEDKWEELPRNRFDWHLSACSLGDKVYVLDPIRRAIDVLYNPDAPVSSQEMHWQEIEVPGDVPIPRYHPVFAPLNSTEIVIARGGDEDWEPVGDILTFDTTTCEFNREVASRDSYYICENN